MNISDAFESYGLSNSFSLSGKIDLYNTSAGAFAVGKISDEERFDVVRHACPGAGACGGMFTANTMSSALEVSFANVVWFTVFELREGTWHVLALFFEHACVVPWYLSAQLSFCPVLILTSREGARVYSSREIYEESASIGLKAKVRENLLGSKLLDLQSTFPEIF